MQLLPPRKPHSPTKSTHGLVDPQESAASIDHRIRQRLDSVAAHKTQFTDGKTLEKLVEKQLEQVEPVRVPQRYKLMQADPRLYCTKLCHNCRVQLTIDDLTLRNTLITQEH